MADRVRIGFIGAGNMGQCAHLRHYASLPDCEIVALAELRSETAAAVARKYGIGRVYPDHRELLANEEVDALVCIQPYRRHGILLPELAAAGKPMMIEKPLTGNLAYVETIRHAFEANRTWAMLGYHKRSDPGVVHAKGEIDRLRSSGELGRQTYVRVSMSPGDWIAGGWWDRIDAGDPKPDLAIEADPEDLDPAERELWWDVVNVWIHQINMLHLLLGEAYHVTHADRGGLLLVGESESGISCLIERGPYRTTRDWHESALTTFERGSVRIEMPPPLAVNRCSQVEILHDPGKHTVPQWVTPVMPAVDAMHQQAVNFLRAVRGEIQPPCGIEEGVRDLQVALEYVKLLNQAKSSSR